MNDRDKAKLDDAYVKYFNGISHKDCAPTTYNWFKSGWEAHAEQPDEWKPQPMPSFKACMTDAAIKSIEAQFDIKNEAVKLIDLIAAEFNSDPQSVVCFDLDVVKRVQYIAALARHERML